MVSHDVQTVGKYADHVLHLQNSQVFFGKTEDYIKSKIGMKFLGGLIYEGIFDVYEIVESAEKYYSVIRYGPGCCGTDGNAGFEVKWDGKYPNQNDWVEVTGTLEEYEENGYNYLRIAIDSLTVLPVRGAETVYQ